MNESDVKVANIQVNDPSHADMDVINGIYLIENNSMIQVKKEIQDLEEETSSKRGCMLPNFILNSERKIKEEIHDSDHDHIYVKDEPLTITKEGSTVASCLESANINEERCKDIKSCYKNLKRKKSKIQADLPMGVMGITQEEATMTTSNQESVRAGDSCEALPCGTWPEETKREESHLMKKRETGLTWYGDEYWLELDENFNDEQNQISHEANILGQERPSKAVNYDIMSHHLPNMIQSSNEKSSLAPTTQDLSPPAKTLDISSRKRHFCPTCHKEFTRKSSLVTHLLIHAGEKPFTCDVCEKTFTKKSELVNHLRIHTGEKPYECPVCLKKFSNNSTLRRHSLIHSGDWPYKCQVCSKGFGHDSHLREHERIHTGEKPYKCSACPKSFSQTSNLKRHELIHTGQKQHKCSTCSKEFIRNSDLKIHEWIHTGEKPHKCPVCSRGFVRNSDLRKHKQIHTPEYLFNYSVYPKIFDASSDTLHGLSDS